MKKRCYGLIGICKRLLVLFILLVGATSAFAQGHVVKGTVKDGQGLGIPGVNVIIKGTTSGTSTDIDGKYQIKVGKGAVLLFSCIGFENLAVPVKGKKVLDVSLKDSSVGLEEVVAVGYGTMKKSDLTGSVSRVSAELFKEQNTVSIDQALSGRAAGVQVVTNSGAPGAGVSIRIRGGTSINASNEPLYVIDGFPYANSESNSSTGGIGFDSENPMVNIDPNDIESMEVLKDASATAIYGSRGANGVILITTKSGKKGKAKLSYSGYFGLQSVAKKIPMMNGEEYANYMHIKDASDDRFTDEQGLPISYADSTSFNWQDEVFRTAQIQSHNINLTGGNDKTQYAFSLGYLDNEGVVIDSKLERYSSRLKINQKYNEKLDLGANISLGYTEDNGVISAGTQSGANSGLMTNTLIFRPVAVMQDGKLIDYDDTGVKTNPVTFAEQIDKITNSLRVVANFDAKYKFTNNLSFRTVAGGNFNNLKRKQYYPSNVGAGRQTLGKAILSDVNRVVWLNENYFTFTKKIGVHKFNAMAGLSFQKSILEKFDVTNTNFEIESNGADEIQLGKDPLTPTSSHNEWSLLSYYARLNYNYDNRYLFTGTYRIDGSSKFGSNNRYGYFPSLSVAWRVTEEDFMKEQEWITNFKVRAGWGMTGNQDIGEDAFKSMLTQGNYSFGGTPQTGVKPNNIGNPDLKWETTVSYNAGVDLSFLNNRLSLTLDYYQKYTKDLLLNAPLDYVLGYPSVMANIGEVSNKGFEFAISSVNVKSDDFTWTTDFNFSTNKNRIEKLVNKGQDIYVNAKYNSTVPVTYVLREGESVGSMYGYVWDKGNALYQTGDFLWQNDSDWEIPHKERNYVLVDGTPQVAGSPAPQPGDIRYQDVRKRDENGKIVKGQDGVVNADDRVIIGNGLPKFFGGITNKFQYKDWDLSIFLQYSYGNDVFNANKYDTHMSNIDKNQHEDVLNAWTIDNQNTTQPRINGFGAVAPSSYLVEDGSYLRINNVTLGYNFPKRILRQINLSKLRVYASVNNLYTFTDYSGFSPDVSVNGGVQKSLVPGLDYSSYPQVRTLLFGVNVNF